MRVGSDGGSEGAERGRSSEGISSERRAGEDRNEGRSGRGSGCARDRRVCKARDDGSEEPRARRVVCECRVGRNERAHSSTERVEQFRCR